MDSFNEMKNNTRNIIVIIIINGIYFNAVKNSLVSFLIYYPFGENIPFVAL